MPNEMRYASTVVSFYESTGQIFCHHVTPPDAMQAFRACAHKRDQANESLIGYRHWLRHRLTRPT